MNRLGILVDVSHASKASMMQAVVGPAETSLYHVPLGFFAPGTPMASDAGMGVLAGPPDG